MNQRSNSYTNSNRYWPHRNKDWMMFGPQRPNAGGWQPFAAVLFCGFMVPDGQAVSCSRSTAWVQNSGSWHEAGEKMCHRKFLFQRASRHNQQLNIVDTMIDHLPVPTLDSTARNASDKPPAARSNDFYAVHARSVKLQRSLKHGRCVFAAVRLQLELPRKQTAKAAEFDYSTIEPCSKVFNIDNISGLK